MDESRLMGPKTIQEENTQGIMIYQSMSGDAEEGKKYFFHGRGIPYGS